MGGVGVMFGNLRNRANEEEKGGRPTEGGGSVSRGHSM